MILLAYCNGIVANQQFIFLIKPFYLSPIFINPIYQHSYIMESKDRTPGFHRFKAIYHQNEKQISDLIFTGGFTNSEIKQIEECISKEFVRCFDEELLLTISSQHQNLRWTINGQLANDSIEFIVSINRSDESLSKFSIEAVRIPEKKIKPGCSDRKNCIHYQVLTPREKEILKHIVAGLSNQKIGANLYISKNTVDIHRTNIYRKLEVKNLKELLNKYYLNLDAYCYCCFE